MFNFFHSLFVPHFRNNHRAKLLHNSGLFVLFVLLLFLSFAGNFAGKIKPEVLGISYSVSAQKLLFLTNKARKENNLLPLVLNEKLSQAAELKGEDMFKKDYWAHFAPDGTTPWDFIKKTGYKYTYAGENLAKGFTLSEDAENAWLASPGHRENILSNKYKDVGFAILEGKLQGEDTILIVELFGSQSNMAIEENANRKAEISVSAPSVPVLGKNINSDKVSIPLIDLAKSSKTLIVSILLVLLATLTVDFIIVERKKIPRLVGHNLDHIMLIGLFILFIFLRKTGIIF